MVDQEQSSRKKIVILGAGLAGLSAAYHFEGKRDYEIFEKEDRPGGLCRSEKIDGFIFDHSVHVLYTKDPYAVDLIHKLLGDNLIKQNKSAWIYLYHTFTRFPFQANTFGLPVDVVKDCLLGLIKAKFEPETILDHSLPRNFEEWILLKFGPGIAQHFMLPFNRKLWAIEPSEMNFDWIEGRVPDPSLQEVLDGALGEQVKGFGPNAEFWYPREGGMEALPQSFLPYIRPVHLHSEASKIDLKQQIVYFKDGVSIPYQGIISSLPLPVLINICQPVPKQIKEFSKQLKFNTVYAVNLGIRRANISDKHWIYYSEEKYPFHRISLPMNFSPATVPAGFSAVTAEVSASEYKDINLNTLLEDVIEGLCDAEILKPDDELLVKQVLELSPAYIIYDDVHRQAVDTIRNYFSQNNIESCGRFGEWEYYNMDHAILSGKKAAEKFLP